jgi:hypothetical protein
MCYVAGSDACTLEADKGRQLCWLFYVDAKWKEGEEAEATKLRFMFDYYDEVRHLHSKKSFWSQN